MNDPTIKSATPIEGGEEIVIDVPTPAGNVHPDTTVVPADAPDSVPVTAGELAPDVLVVTVPVDTTTDTPPPPTPSGHPGDTPTTTAGEVGNAIVVRPSDPDATPIPAGDLDPSTVVFDPSADLTPADRGPVTAAELAAAVKGPGGQALTSDNWQPILDTLDRSGYRIVRK